MNALLLLPFFLLTAPPPRPSSGAPETSTSTRAFSDAEVEARIEHFLGAIDTPIPPSTWRALGPHAVTVLERISADEKTLPSRRALAVDGYVTLAPRGAVAHLSGLAHRADTPRGVRLSAIRGLGVLASKDELLALLSSTLGDADEHVRATTAQVLAAQVPDTACAEVELRAQAEGAHREAFRKALTLCEDR